MCVYPSVPVQMGPKETIPSFSFATDSPEFLLNRCSYHELLSNMTFILCRKKSPHCPPPQRALKPTSQASGDRMSLLSRHLAFPAQVSNFLWLFFGLPSTWEGGVDNEPHLGGSWVPEAPFLHAFEESIHVLPGGLPLWPASLFPISSGKSIKM